MPAPPVARVASCDTPEAPPAGPHGVPVRLVLLDWTGVVMDEIEATGRAHVATMAQLGARPTTYEDWLAAARTDWRRFYLSRGVPPARLAGAERLFCRHFRRWAHLVQPYSGVAELLARLRQRGILVAVLSGQFREVVLLSARKFDLLDALDLIVAAEDVPRPKPDAAALRHVLRQLRVRPRETVLVDDMDDGIRMGLEVGVITAGVRSGLSHALSRADLHLDSAVGLLDRLEGTTLTATLPRPLEVATPESVQLTEDRYRQKAAGLLPRLAASYRADNHAFADQIVAWGVVTTNARVADVGCGTAVYSGDLAARLAARCLLLDLSETALREQRAGPAGRREQVLPSVVADSARLPLPDASFDAVLCSETLEHVVDDCAVVAELSRCLRPGGHLIVSVPTDTARTFPLFRPLQRVFDRAGHVREYRAGDLEALLSAHGLHPVEIRSSSFLAYWALFSLDRSRLAHGLRLFFERSPRLSAVWERLFHRLLRLENRALGGRLAGGMCSICLAVREEPQPQPTSRPAERSASAARAEGRSPDC